jgi:hypothetical protein
MEWTPEALELLPDTVEWIKSCWPNDGFQRVRVMCLEPKGWIGVHKDYDIPGLGPSNISITQPENCAFYMQGAGVIPFDPGQAHCLDVSNLHAVINDSDEPRYHLIIHHKENSDWQRLFMRSYGELPCKD